MQSIELQRSLGDAAVRHSALNLRFDLSKKVCESYFSVHNHIKNELVICMTSRIVRSNYFTMSLLTSIALSFSSELIGYAIWTDLSENGLNIKLSKIENGLNLKLSKIENRLNLKLSKIKLDYFEKCPKSKLNISCQAQKGSQLNWNKNWQGFSGKG